MPTTAIRQFVDIQLDGRLEISAPGLLKAGQRAEVIVLLDVPELVVADERAARAARVQALAQLLKDTQALPGVADLTDADIAAEIAAYRAGQ